MHRKATTLCLVLLAGMFSAIGIFSFIDSIFSRRTNTQTNLALNNSGQSQIALANDAAIVGDTEEMKVLKAAIKGEQIKAENISKFLLGKLDKRQNFENKQFTFEQLRSYYLKCLSAFAGHYPNGTFRLNEEAFSPYSDKAYLGSVEVYLVPPLPIVPENYYDTNKMEFHKLTAQISGTTIYGLRFTSWPNEKVLQYQRVSRNMGAIALPYMTDLNGRLMGFTHAQLILELSENVQPGDFFEYNEMFGWEKHNRYRREDQINKPIQLTNVAHLAGSSFNVSDHPDFSIKIMEPRTKPAKLTFFLWRSDLAPEGQKVLAGRLPDFIYQIVLKL